MKKFKEFLREQEYIAEGLLGNIYVHFKKTLNSFLNKFKKLFSKLKFGQSKEISISFVSALNESTESIDLKSRLGYYSEYVTGWRLAELLESKGLTLSKTNTTKLKKFSDNYLKTKIIDVKDQFDSKTLKSIDSEVFRMQESGMGLAQQLLEDIKYNAEDIEFLEFEIELTGDSGKGITKADVVFRVKKKNEKEIQDEIMASLKAYKSWNINLANNTFMSWLVNLLGGDIQYKNLNEFVEKFVSKYGDAKSKKSLQELLKYQRTFIPLKKKIGREKAKQHIDEIGLYSKARDIMIQVFESQYKKRKEEINDNFLELLGFDGSDEMYMAVKTSEKSKVQIISTRTSKELKKLAENLKGNFDVKFRTKPGKVSAEILFMLNKEILFKSDFAFRDGDKVSSFVNFNKL